jgi:hypothetical protein
MFIPIAAQYVDTKIYTIIQQASTCFGLSRPSSGRYSTKKKKNTALGNYDVDVQL